MSTHPGAGAEGRLGARALAELIRERCQFSYARSGGPGGQNVNKVATKVIARLPLAALDFLGPERRQRVETRLFARLSAEGDIVVTVQDTREQARNRDIAVERLAALILAASIKPKRRVKTRPTRSSREARLRSKKVRSAHKRLRGPAAEE
jgi:ribosome-associated protein